MKAILVQFILADIIFPLLDLLDVGLAEMSAIGTQRSRIQNRQTSPDLMKMPIKEDIHVSPRRLDRFPFGFLHEKMDDFKGFKDQHNEIEFSHDNDYSFQPRDDNLAKFMLTVTPKRGNHPWMSDINFPSDEEYVMESRSTAAKRSNNVEDNIFSSAWQDQPFKLHPSVSNGSAGSGVSHDHHEISSDVEVTCDLRQPFLKSCSSRERLPSERDLFAESEIKFQNDGFGSKRMRDCSYNTVDVLEIDGSSKRMRGGSYDSVEVPDFLSRTMWPGEVSSAQPFPRVLSKVDPFTEFDPLSKAFYNSMPTCGEHFDGANLDRSEEDIGSCNQTLNTEWCSVTSNPLSLNAYLDFEPLSNKNSVEGHYKSDNRATEKYFVEGEEFDCSFGLDIIPNTLEYCTTHMDCGLDSNDYAGSRKFLHQDNVDREFCAGRPDILADETDWLRWHSCGKDNIGIDMHNRQKYQLKNQDFLKCHVSIGRSIRSHSAPPFHRSKRKYFMLNHSLTTAGKHDAATFPGITI